MDPYDKQKLSEDNRFLNIGMVIDAESKEVQVQIDELKERLDTLFALLEPSDLEHLEDRVKHLEEVCAQCIAEHQGRGL